MKRAEIINVCVLLLAVLGAVYAFGVLNGRINTLQPEKITEAQEKALRAIDARLGAFKILPATETFSWRESQEPVQMIAVSEGICYLTLITGFFHNEDEDVAKVFVLGDHWYLGGSTSKHATKAEATCWRFPEVRGNR